MAAGVVDVPHGRPGHAASSACSASQLEEMGWGTRPEDVRPCLPPGARFVTLADTGHFVHIEQPELIADLVLDFLRTP